MLHNHRTHNMHLEGWGGRCVSWEIVIMAVLSRLGWSLTAVPLINPPAHKQYKQKANKNSHFLSATLAALIYLPLLVGESVSGAANLEFDTSNPDCVQDPDPDPDQDHHRDHHQDHRQVHEQDHVLSVQFRTLATFLYK